jgi:hypothetical protein
LQLIIDVQTARFWTDWDGTVMEHSGRNRWQTFGSRKDKNGLLKRQIFAVGCHPLL